jgi:hypothetical protein
MVSLCNHFLAPIFQPKHNGGKVKDGKAQKASKLSKPHPAEWAMVGR